MSLGGSKAHPIEYECWPQGQKRKLWLGRTGV